MTTVNVGTADNTVNLYIDLMAKIDGGSLTAMANNTIDGDAGFDTFVVDDPISTSHFTLSIPDTGLITLTTSSGSVSISNFEKLKFKNATLDIGGSGNDTVNGSVAAGSTLYGFAGDDTLNGSAGADKMYGGSGNDIFVFNNAGDQLFESAGQGTDTVQSSLTFTLATDFEKLTLTGIDAINGTGNVGANTIIGNDGVNIITGLKGRDVMTGGLGKDSFVFKAVTDTTKAAATRDVITDFKHLTDKINLSAIDANTKLGNNQAFKLLGTNGAAFTGVAGQLHYKSASGHTIIEGDTNGDKHADFQIDLVGTIKVLSTGDFNL